MQITSNRMSCHTTGMYYDGRYDVMILQKHIAPYVHASCARRANRKSMARDGGTLTSGTTDVHSGTGSRLAPMHRDIAVVSRYIGCYSGRARYSGIPPLYVNVGIYVSHRNLAFTKLSRVVPVWIECILGYECTQCRTKTTTAVPSLMMQYHTEKGIKCPQFSYWSTWAHPTSTQEIPHLPLFGL